MWKSRESHKKSLLGHEKLNFSAPVAYLSNLSEFVYLFMKQDIHGHGFAFQGKAHGKIKLMGDTESLSVCTDAKLLEQLIVESK